MLAEETTGMPKSHFDKVIKQLSSPFAYCPMSVCKAASRQALGSLVAVEQRSEEPLNAKAATCSRNSELKQWA